jgi:hypothetical protein
MSINLREYEVLSKNAIRLSICGFDMQRKRPRRPEKPL